MFGQAAMVVFVVVFFLPLAGTPQIAPLFHSGSTGRLARVEASELVGTFAALHLMRTQISCGEKQQAIETGKEMHGTAWLFMGWIVIGGLF